MTAGKSGFIPPFQDLRTLAAHICVGESTIERWVRQGKFPKPKNQGGKRLWRWTDVERHLAVTQPSEAPSDDADRIREATRHAIQTAERR